MTFEDRQFPEGEDKKFALDPVRLRFKDAVVEANFVNETLTNSINYIRAYLVAGTGLYVLFGLLDSIVGGETVTTLLAIRYGIVTPVLVGIFVVTFFPIFFRIPQFFLGMAMFAAGMGVVAMASVMDPPFNSMYYAGLVMVVIYCGALIHLQYAYALAIAIFLIVSYQFASLWLNPLTYFQYVNNNFFLIMAIGVGLFSNYFQETYLRRTYVSQKIIEARNELTHDLLDRANKAHHAKRDFLAMISHELRTPLNAIIGFSDILKKQMFGRFQNERYASYSADIFNSGTHLLTIINEILDVARFDVAEMQLEEKEIDVSAVVDICVRMFLSDAAAKKIDLTTYGLDRHVRALVDEKRIRQIVLNLLSNAVKFTPAGGHIHVQLVAGDEEGIAISVSDSGVGIAPENIERALKPFEQIENIYSRQHTGTGLGLSITDRLAKLHGGTLAIESAVNVGTTVTVRLPAYRMAANRDQAMLKEAV